MDIIIHRGTKQIGGCVTEIKTDKAQIFIDFGSELPDMDGNVPSEFLTIEGLTKGPRNCDGVFFTHYHGDHIGMLSHIMGEVPLYMGQAAKEIYLTFQKRIRKDEEVDTTWFRTFQVAEKIKIKDISITPLLVDHSAYDAYMFLIEAGGKRILHTGDFRTHGFRGKGVLPTIGRHVGRVDVLIIEGTNLYKDEQAIISEKKLQEKIKTQVSKFNYIFAICPSTNIDRIASFNKSTPKGKYFFCDSYQEEIINIARNYGATHSPLYTFKKLTTYGKNLEKKAIERGFIMMVRSNKMFLDIMNKYRENYNSECLVIYSMWEGYLQQENSSLKLLMEGFQNIIHLHTSGHATKKAIVDVCNIVSPRQAIIPIHTNKPKEFNTLDLPYNIKYLEDGESFKIE